MSRNAMCLAIVFILAASTAAFAQSKPAEHPSGATTQPQGNTGPLTTKTGGAPAASPQGETPPGMQAAPQGSDQPIRTDRNGVAEGTPKR